MEQTLTPPEIREFERILRELQASANRRADDLQGASLEDTGMERVSRDDEAAEQTVLERDIPVIQAEEQVSRQALEALERIEQGTFGTCESCGNPIGRERLRAIPYATRCIDCAE